MNTWILTISISQVHSQFMWGGQAKWIWTCTHHIFCFLLYVMLHSKSYILQKSPSKLDKSLQSYGLLNGFENNRKQRDLFPLFSFISKSILVPTHFAWSYHILSKSSFCQTWLLTSSGVVMESHQESLSTYTWYMNTTGKIANCVYSWSHKIWKIRGSKV